MSDTVKITFEIEGVEHSIDQLNDMGTAAKKTGGKVEEANKKATESSKEASKELGILGEGVKSVGDFAKKLGADFVNGFNGVKKFAQGLGLSAKASKGLAIGLSALGIPILLMAVAALIDFFKNFEAGTKILTTTMNVLGKVVGNITEAFTKLFAADFAGFFSQLGETGKVVKDAVNNTNALFEAESRLADMNKTMVVENAKLRNELDLQQKVLEDNTISYEDKTAALEKIGVAEQQLLANAIALTKAEEQRLMASIALEKNFETRRQLEQELAGVQASLIEQQGDLERTRFDVDKKVRELDEERAAAAKEARDKALEEEKARVEAYRTLYEKLSDDELNLLAKTDQEKLDLEKKRGLVEINALTLRENEKAKLIEQFNQVFEIKQQELNQKLADAAEAKKAADLLRETDLQFQLQQFKVGETDTLLDNADIEVQIQIEKYQRLIDEAIKNDQSILALEALREAEIAKIKTDAQLAEDERLQAIREKEQADLIAAIDNELTAAQEKIAIRAMVVDSIASIAGQETAIGKAAFVAQQILRLQDLKATALTALRKLAIDQSTAGASIAVGFAQTAKIGFPQNVPLLIGYAAQAAAIIGSIKSAFSKARQPLGGGGGGGSGPSTVSAPQVAAPDASQVFRAAEAASPAATEAATGRLQQSRMNQAPVVKAFVIAGDVSNAQEADQKIQKLSRL